MTLNEEHISKTNNTFCAPLMPKTIESERISLRQLEATPQNAQLLAESVSENAKHLSEFMTSFCCLSDPQKAFEKLQKANDKPSQCYYFIFHKDRIIGSICLLEDDKEREIQYWVDRRYEGSGYVSEAIKAIEKQAFQLSEKQLMLMIDMENMRSQRVAMKANFRPIDSQKTEWVKTYEEYAKGQTQAPVSQKRSNFSNIILKSATRS